MVHPKNETARPSSKMEPTLISARHLVPFVSLAWIVVCVNYALARVTASFTHDQQPPWGDIAAYYSLRCLGWSALTWIVVALIDRHPAMRMSWRVALFGVGPGMVAAALLDLATSAAITALLDPARTFGPLFVSRLSDGFHQSLIWVFVIIAAGHGVRFQNAKAEARLREMRLEAALTDARLQMLSSRMQPHFLFNTLHSIAALIREDPAAAETMVSRLGDLLRTAIRAGDAQLVPLAEELRLVETYLSIQQVRYSDRMHSTIEASEEASRCQVPRFILQPLAENAVRHGVEPLDTTADVSVRAFVEGDRLVLKVRNSAPLQAQPNETSDGLGLRATRERLALIYGPDYEFECANCGDAHVEATIRIPITREPRSVLRTTEPGGITIG